jgi:hypothetical protein
MPDRKQVPQKIISFDSCMKKLIQDQIQNGKNSSAETYNAIFKRVHWCFGDQEICFTDINKNWVLTFKSYLIKSSLSANTINTYLAFTRNVYNRILTLYDIERSRSPFQKVAIVKKTVPKKIPDISLFFILRHSKLVDQEYLMFSRDLFLFSYYAGGMSFRDMALLKKESLIKGCLHYKKGRSGSKKVVRLTSDMKKIINDYQVTGSSYVFPIIKNPKLDIYQQYRSGLRKYNLHLKKLASLLHINTPLYTPMSFMGILSKDFLAKPSELHENNLRQCSL